MTSEVRLAELLAALSLATDLGAGWPPETALKTTAAATAPTWSATPWGPTSPSRRR
jgi:hypothetical protein